MSMYLDDLLNIDNIYLDGMVKICPNKAKFNSDTEASFLNS